MDWPGYLMSFALGSVITALAYGTRIGILDSKMAGALTDLGGIEERLRKAEKDINGVAIIARGRAGIAAVTDDTQEGSDVGHS